MILRRIAEAFRRQDWFVVFIELLVLIVGIYVGLQVDDWNKARQDRQTESIYLSEFMEDFQSDQENLEESIGEAGEILTAMIGLLEQSSLETPTWTVAELNDAFRNIQRMPTFDLNDRVFSNLTGSGDLKLIQNRELKYALAGYYRDSKLTNLVQNTHEMELVQTFQPYLIENMDYQAVHHSRVDDFPLPPSMDRDQILEVLKTQEFRNIVTQKWVIMTDLLNQFRGMRERNEEITEILEKEMGLAKASQ